MKYAFFTPTCNVGGYERVVLNLANYLLSKHNDVIIICGNKDGELVSLFNKKIKIISLNTRAKKNVNTTMQSYKRRESRLHICRF